MLRPAWCADLNVTWAAEGDLSKLLGAVFELDPKTSDANSFLEARIDKALEYWSIVQMNAYGRAVIINGVLLSGLWYFLSIWGGIDAGVSKIRGQLFNFLWAGDPKRGRNRVNWLTCCQSKEEGGLNLINPEDAVVALMTN